MSRSVGGVATWQMPAHYRTPEVRRHAAAWVAVISRKRRINRHVRRLTVVSEQAAGFLRIVSGGPRPNSARACEKLRSNRLFCGISVSFKDYACSFE